MLPDDSEFCQYCGARIKNTADKNDANDSKEELQMPTPDVVVATQEKTEPIITAIPASEPINNPIEPLFIEEDSESPKEAYNNSTETKEERQVDVENPQGTNKKQKTRYCKKCGTMIDPKTKKCPNCNPLKKKRFCKNCGIEIPAGEKKCPQCKNEKQSSGINKAILMFLLIATIIVLAVFCVFQYMQIDDLQSEKGKLDNEIVSLKSNNEDLTKHNNDLQTQNKSLQTENENLKTKNKNLQSEIDSLEERYDDYWDKSFKLWFYEEYVVVVADDGTNKYHKYGCEDFDGDFWAFNVEAAKGKGYKACKKCID